MFVQPVLVSGIHKRLNTSLWKADSFNQEFADHQGDLLNCKDQVVTNSDIKEFWDGFEDITSEITCVLHGWPNGEADCVHAVCGLTKACLLPIQSDPSLKMESRWSTG